MTNTRPLLIVFDCDGVLIDSETIVARAHADALAALGCPVTLDDLLLRFTGVPDREMYPVIEAEWGRRLPPDYDERINTDVERSYRSDLCAIDGIHETLARLEYPVCVASSSSPEKLKLGLGQVGLLERFAPHIFSAHQVARGKPAPDIFLFAAAQMGFAPADCLVIEDSVAGVEAARAAGLGIVGFPGGSHCGDDHSERLARAGASTILTDIRDLPDFVRLMLGRR